MDSSCDPRSSSHGAISKRSCSNLNDDFDDDKDFSNLEREIFHGSNPKKKKSNQNEDEEKLRHSSNEDHYGLPEMKMFNPWMDEVENEENSTTKKEKYDPSYDDCKSIITIKEEPLDMDISDNEVNNSNIQSYEQNQSFLGSNNNNFDFNNSVTLNTTNTQSLLSFGGYGIPLMQNYCYEPSDETKPPPLPSPPPPAPPPPPPPAETTQNEVLPTAVKEAPKQKKENPLGDGNKAKELNKDSKCQKMILDREKVTKEPIVPTIKEVSKESQSAEAATVARQSAQLRRGVATSAANVANYGLNSNNITLGRHSVPISLLKAYQGTPHSIRVQNDNVFLPTASGLCWRCGRPGHARGKCPAENKHIQFCSRCGLLGVKSSACCNKPATAPFSDPFTPAEGYVDKRRAFKQKAPLNARRPPPNLPKFCWNCGVCVTAIFD
ncbi:unnamed protein product [Brassicogethes aeneus]|uniref:CCHC-type domain-containing protein n=1 Tax=Brassicogethes aeneus TaxID=1431903 RepID=A0A9P0FKE7_BRAAE|nr:unnamed protein product [Brassicogethes aeneus]